MLVVGGACVRGGPRGRRACGRRDTRVAEAEPACGRGGPRDIRVAEAARVRGGPRDRGFPDSVQPRTGNAHALRSGDYRSWRRHDAEP